MVANEALTNLYREYEKAVYDESCIRELAFLPVTLTIASIEVRQFTPYHYILLDFIRSPFVGGTEEPTVESIAEFLWIVSADYKDNDPAGKNKFINEKVAQVNYIQALEDIGEYVTNAFLDVPPPLAIAQDTKRDSIPYYAWIVSYIDVLASEYGWQERDCLHMNFSKLFQYIRAIEARKSVTAGKEPVMYNKISDEVKVRIREEANKAKAQAEKQQERN
jgi:hypothetical protein